MAPGPVHGANLICKRVSIMFDSFASLLCSKLCLHNVDNPIHSFMFYENNCNYHLAFSHLLRKSHMLQKR